MAVHRRARAQDADALARVSKRAFDHDVHYGAPGPDGPPGYDSSAWQRRMMRVGDYYVIEQSGEVIGGRATFTGRLGLSRRAKMGTAGSCSCDARLRRARASWTGTRKAGR